MTMNMASSFDYHRPHASYPSAMPDAPSGNCLTFALDGLRYGLDLACVREIVKRAVVQPAPCASAFAGTAAVRGKAVPVVDLRARLGRSPRRPDEMTLLVVVLDAFTALPLVVGILVDDVLEVRSKAFERAALRGDLDEARALQKIVSADVVLIDFENFFSDAERAAASALARRSMM
ncbi:MAG: hypothetical protein C4523_17515 [Myxococcales bacterium]|nr:MAG: hypothetical protein C4523_17515 [Myxococcales bacterium]